MMNIDNPFIESEDDFLALIAKVFPNSHHSLILGRGDDCAEICCPPKMAVSTDLFVEDIHFRQRYFTPEEIGWKAMAVNISDMAAAGARPLGVSIGLVAPTPFSRESALGIIHGMRKAADTYDIALTGGDLSRGEKLSFCATIWGAPAIKPFSQSTPLFLRRGPVAPGHVIFLCGRIGLARAGLALLEKYGRDAVRDYPASCAAHLTPEPLVATGLALAAVSGCRLMDVSDGLLRDLPRMLAAYGSQYGAAINLPETALHAETVAYARKKNCDPALFAFYGGEDYALLGACPAESFPHVRAAINAVTDAPQLTQLGTVTAEKGIVFNGGALTAAGFDHFTQ